MDLIERARIFATTAHSAVDQRRKFTGEPYICHPAAVASLMSTIAESDEVIAAAWLHDVVEDTGIRLEVIQKEFGSTVAMLVEQVTDVSRLTDGNRAQRKAIDRNHSAAACPSAKSIKLADMIDNLPSIIMGKPSFAKIYVAEQRLLLELLTEGSAPLYHRAKILLDTVPDLS